MACRNAVLDPIPGIGCTLHWLLSEPPLRCDEKNLGWTHLDLAVRKIRAAGFRHLEVWGGLLKNNLIEAFELAPDGTEYVVDSKFRKAAMGKAGWLNANLRTTFGKIVRRAGLEPWPRLFHNLRASRETELVERYPVQVVKSWLGNTPSVAMRHYLMTTDAHFEAAVKGEPKAAQQAHASGSNTSQAQPTAHEKTPDLPGYASACDSTQASKVAGAGFEPAHRIADKTEIADQSGAECGAPGAHSSPIDADLRDIIEAWPKLNKLTKAGIVAMVRAARWPGE